MNKTKSITFAGVICALHIIATILLTVEWIPGIELIILFAVPFFSAFFSHRNKTLYSLILFASTMLICSLINFQETLLYILPTLVVGLLYGFLVKKNCDGTTIVYALTVVEFGLFFLSSYLVQLISKIDVLSTLTTILHFKGENAYLGLGFLLFYSFAQAFLIHIITKEELKKINVNIRRADKPSFFNLELCIIFLVAVFLNYSNDAITFFMAVAAIVFALPLALYGYQSTNKPWIILAVQGAAFLFPVLPLLKKFEESGYKSISAYLILFFPPILFGIYKLIKNSSSKN